MKEFVGNTVVIYIQTTNDSDYQEGNEYYAITLETEDVQEKLDESVQIDLKIEKNLDIPIVICDEQCAQYHQF